MLCSPPLSSSPVSSLEPHKSSIDVARVSWNLSAKIAADKNQSDKIPDASELVPEVYHDLLPTFEKSQSTKLPPHRPYNFRVELIDGANPQFSRPIPLSPAETAVLHDMIMEGLKHGTIRRTQSPWAAPVLFTGKKDGKLRPCFDYRKLNALTVKNKYPLPLTMELVDSLQGASTFTSLDLRNGYNNLRVAKGHEYLLAFTCKDGQFEPLVMPFGPTGAPGFFQFFIQDVFRDRIGQDVAAYLDDILIYTKEGVDHTAAVRQTLTTIRDNNLNLKPEKCKFSKSEIEYLGLIISKNKIRMDPSKVKAIQDWPVPKRVKEVESFIGFGNFYRRFIKDFSRIARPLHDLTKKDVAFEWTEERQQAFDTLKKLFTSAPVLRIADPNLPYVIECDCSDYALGAVLSQIGPDGLLHPIAYFSRSLLGAEINYEIFDKELTALVASVKEWRHYIQGTPHRFDVIIYTDHKNLESFNTTKQLTRRQARWAETLAEFDFTIRFRPGKQSTKPDALSRRPDFVPSAEEKLSFGQLLKPSNLWPDTFISSFESILNADNFVSCFESVDQFFEPDLDVVSVKPEEELEIDVLKIGKGVKDCWDDEKILNKIRELSLQDNQIQEIITACLTSANGKVREILKDFTTEDGILYRRDRVVVPKDDNIKREILRSRHDSLVAGHPGQQKTLSLVSRHYWWPSMKKFINIFVDTCDSCQRVKTRTGKLLEAYSLYQFLLVLGQICPTIL